MISLLDEVMEEIREAATKYPLLPGLVYTSPYDFLVQHGKVYTGTWDRQYRIGSQKHCFGNAIANAVVHRLKYIEGVAVSPHGEVILHGWNANVDQGDRLVDTTWGNSGLLYLGVEFSVERADDATWNGDAHILNDEYRNYPVFQQRWTGEDYTLTWPASDRLEALRGTGTSLPPSMEEWLKEQRRA